MRQSAALSSVSVPLSSTQHAMSQEFFGKWGTEVKERSVITLGFHVPSAYPIICGREDQKIFKNRSNK